MEPIIEDNEYVYFRPGEILYVISHDIDKLLNGQAVIGPNKPQANSEPMNDQATSEPGKPQANSEPGNTEPESLPSEDQGSSELRQVQVVAQYKDYDEDKDDESESSFDQKVDKLIEWSNQLAKDFGLSLTISRRKDRELHFPGTLNLPKLPSFEAFSNEQIKYLSPEPERRGAFSIIPAEIRTSEESNQAENPDRYADPSKLADLAIKLDDARSQNGQPLLGSKIRLELVTPNWLSSPTSEVGGGGGPGSRPEPYRGRSDTDQYKFQLPPKPKGKELWPAIEMQRGKGVKVAILDTAPSLHDLAAAYEFYYKVDPEKRRKQKEKTGLHPLIGTLLGPNGKLHVHAASQADLLRMRNIHLKDHNYNMTDHGLFVAGIVHSIAPAAEIHLYEVLNPEGVGDLESIAKGLWKVAYEQYRLFVENPETPPLVVSCSLMLNIPLQGDPKDPGKAAVIQSDSPHKLVGHRLTDLNREVLNKISRESKWADRSGMLIKWICDLLFCCGSRAIAAAGNDWKPEEDEGRPRARYLAAFPSVQGVGALQKPQNQKAAQTGQYEIASYSDLSDEPGKVGVATLGGEAGEGKGVLGIYLGEFPLPGGLLLTVLLLLQSFLRWIIPRFNGISIIPKNKSHWAWWAGTSFATPILSGVIAAVLSQPSLLKTTEAAIRKLYDSGVIEEARTDYDEDLLNVTQGSLPL